MTRPNRTRRMNGEAKRIDADENAKWLLQTEAPSSTRITIVDNHFATPPTLPGHIVFDGDHVIIRDLTIFPRPFGSWDAIRWGVFRLLRLGVIRRARIRKALGIKQKVRR